MYKRENPRCKECGSNTHWTYQHWGRRTSSKKYALKRKIKPLSATLASKRYSVSSAKKSEQSKRKKLIKELDKYTSLLCRWRYANSEGLVRCFTCGRIMPVWDCQCGHYISRRYQATRWNQNNVRPQGRCCNIYKGGNYEVYEPKIKISCLQCIQCLQSLQCKHNIFPVMLFRVVCVYVWACLCLCVGYNRVKSTLLYILYISKDELRLKVGLVFFLPDLNN